MLDDLHEFLDSIAVTTGEADKVLGLHDERASLGRRGDRDAAPAAELEQAFVPQLPEGAQDGVGVHGEHGGEIARRREPFARFCLAVGDRAANLGPDLLVELGRVVAADLDTEDGASDSSAIRSAMP